MNFQTIPLIFPIFIDLQVVNVASGKLVDTIASWPMTWYVESYVKILKPLDTTSNTYYNIFHFTISGNRDGIGNRIPSLFFKEGSRLYFSIDANDRYNNVQLSYSMVTVPGTKFHVRIEQTLSRLDSEYYTNIFVNHRRRYQSRNANPRNFSNVKVYASSPWLIESKDVFVLQGFKYGRLD